MPVSSADYHEERCSSPFFSLPPPPPPPPILLCLLCGNLGAGKTTILQSLLTSFSPHTSTTGSTTKWFPKNAPVPNLQAVYLRGKKAKRRLPTHENVQNGGVNQDKEKEAIHTKKNRRKGVIKDFPLPRSSCSAVENDKETTKDGATLPTFSSLSAALPSLLPNRTLTIINEYSAYSIDSLAFMPSKEWLSQTSFVVRKEVEESLSQGGMASPPVPRMPPLPEQKLQQQVQRVLHPEMTTNETPRTRAKDFLPNATSSFKGSMSARQEEKTKEKEVGKTGTHSLPFMNTTVELSGGCTCCNLLPALVQVLNAAAEYNEKQYKLFLLAWEEVVKSNSRTCEEAVLLTGTNENSGAGRGEQTRKSSLTSPSRHSFSAGIVESDASPIASSSSSSLCFPYYVYVFLECTGVGESLPIAGTLLSLPSLRGRVVMDLIVTVVDARALLTLVPLNASALLKKSKIEEKIKTQKSQAGERTTNTKRKKTSRRKPLFASRKKWKKGLRQNRMCPTSPSPAFIHTFTKTQERRQLLQESRTAHTVRKAKRWTGDRTPQKKTHRSPRGTRETTKRKINRPLGRKTRKNRTGKKKTAESGKVYPLRRCTTKDDVALLHPFLMSHGGLTKENLKGTNAIVINAWEEALVSAYRRLQVPSATPMIKNGENEKAAASLRWSAVVAHLHHLVKALVRYSVHQTGSVWKNTPGVRSSASSSSFSSVIPTVKVKSFFTNRGDFASVFFSQLYRRELFSTQFLSGGSLSEKNNYFLKAYGEVRVNALREGRFIALVKKEKKRREGTDDTLHSAFDAASEEEEWIEVNMETEEAREREKLGLHQFTLLIRSNDHSSLSRRDEDGHAPPSMLRISSVRKMLHTTRGAALFRHVWRSKGFFYAVDDDDEGRVYGELPMDSHSMSNAEKVERAPLAAVCAAPVGDHPLKVKQFRWQTAGRHIRFGEVLPPYVPLFSQMMEVQEEEEEEKESEKKEAVEERSKQRETGVLNRENGEGLQREKEEGHDKVDFTTSSSPTELSALIVFLGNFSTSTGKEDEKEINDWQTQIRSLFTTDLDGGSISFFMNFSLAHLRDEDLLQLTENVLVRLPPENALYRHLCQRKKNTIQKKNILAVSQEGKRSSSASRVFRDSGDATRNDVSPDVEEYLYNEDRMESVTPFDSFASASNESRQKVRDTKSTAFNASSSSASSPLFSSPQHQMDEQISVLLHSLLRFPRRENAPPHASGPPFVSEPSTLLPSGSSGVSSDQRGIEGLPRGATNAASGGSISPFGGEDDVEHLTKEIALVPQEAEALHQEWKMLVSRVSHSPSMMAVSHTPLLSTPPSSTTDHTEWRHSFLLCLQHTMTIFHRWLDVLRTHRVVRFAIPTTRRHHAVTERGRKKVWFSSSTGSTSGPPTVALYRQLQVNTIPRGVLLALTPYLTLLESVLPPTIASIVLEKEDEDENGSTEEGEGGRRAKKEEVLDRVVLAAYLVELTPLVWSLIGVLDENPVLGHWRQMPDGQWSRSDGDKADASLHDTESASEGCSTLPTPRRDILSFSIMLPLLWRTCHASSSGIFSLPSENTSLARGGVSSSSSTSSSTSTLLPPSSSTAVYLNLCLLALQQWIAPFLHACLQPLQKTLQFHFSTSSSSSSASPLLHPSFFFELWQEQRQHLFRIRHHLLQCLLPLLQPRSVEQENLSERTPGAEGEALSMCWMSSSTAAYQRRSENSEVVLSVLCGMVDRLLTQRAVSLFTTYFSWATLVKGVLHPPQLETIVDTARTMGDTAGEDRPTAALRLVQHEEGEERGRHASDTVPRTSWERRDTKEEEETKRKASASRDPSDACHARCAPSSSSSSSALSISSGASAARAFVLSGIHCSLEFLASLSHSSSSTAALLPPSHAVDSPFPFDEEVPWLVFSSFSASFASAYLLHHIFQPIALRSLWLQHLRAIVTPPPSLLFFSSSSSSSASSAEFPMEDQSGGWRFPSAAKRPSAALPAERVDPPWTWAHTQQQAQRRALLLQPRGALRRLWKPHASVVASPYEVPRGAFSPPFASSHECCLLFLPEWTSLDAEDQGLRRLLWYPTLHLLHAIEDVLLPLVVQSVWQPSRVAASLRTAKGGEGGLLGRPLGHAPQRLRPRRCRTAFRVGNGEVEVVVEEWRAAIWQEVLSPCLLLLLRQLEKGGVVDGVGGGGMDGGLSVAWPLSDKEWDLDLCSWGKAGMETERKVHDIASECRLIGADERRRRRWCRAQLDEGNRLGFPFHHTQLFHYYRTATSKETVGRTPLGWWRPARALLVELECLHRLRLAVREWRVQLGEDASAIDTDEETEDEEHMGHEGSTPANGIRRPSHFQKRSSSPAAVSALLLALQYEHTLEELCGACDRGVADCFSVLPSTQWRWGGEEREDMSDDGKGRIGAAPHCDAGKNSTEAQHEEEEEMDTPPHAIAPPFSTAAWLVPSAVTNDAWHALNLFLLHGRRAAKMEKESEACVSSGYSLYTAAPSGGPAEPLAVLYDLWAMVEHRIALRVQQHLEVLFLPHHRGVSFSSSTHANATAKQAHEMEMPPIEDVAWGRKTKREEKNPFRDVTRSFYDYLNQIGCPVAATMLPTV